MGGAAGPAHFIAIECSMQWLFKGIPSGGQGSPPDFDVDGYNLAQTPKYDGLALEDIRKVLGKTPADRR